MRQRLASSRQRAARLRAERDVLRLQLMDAGANERSVTAELYRLRELAFGRADREPPEAQPNYLFVVSCGRTGSTLVQGVLNSVPGVLVRGENGGILIDLFHIHGKAAYNRDRLNRKTYVVRSTNPWWGIDGYPEDLALREFRHLATDLLLRPTPGAHTIGFKEIKWAEGEVAEYLGFLREVFPGARFIFSSRNLEDVSASGWWAKRPDAMAELSALDGEMRAAVGALGSAGFELRYEDFADDPDGLRPLFDWLGFEFDRPVIAAVMAQRHSFPTVTPAVDDHVGAES